MENFLLPCNKGVADSNSAPHYETIHKKTNKLLKKQVAPQDWAKVQLLNSSSGSTGLTTLAPGKSFPLEFEIIRWT